MNMPTSDLILQPPGSALLDLGVQQHHHQMNHLRGIYRNENGNHLLGMPPPGPDQLNSDDLNCLMSNVIFHHPAQHQPIASVSPNVIFNHPPQQQPNQQQMIESRKRHNGSISINEQHPQQMNELPIKRSMSVAPATPLDHRVQPSIKPEPDTLSPLCASALVDSPISTRRR